MSVATRVRPSALIVLMFAGASIGTVLLVNGGLLCPRSPYLAAACCRTASRWEPMCPWPSSVNRQEVICQETSNDSASLAPLQVGWPIFDR